MSYKAVRNERFKLIHWLQHQDADELYDLERDPHEMTNLIDDPAYARTLAELRATLARLAGEIVS